VQQLSNFQESYGLEAVEDDDRDEDEDEDVENSEGSGAESTEESDH
jgi:hypothetical protein